MLRSRPFRTVPLSHADAEAVGADARAQCTVDVSRRLVRAAIWGIRQAR